KLAVRSKVKKGLRTSLYHEAVDDLRHHSHKDLDEEFQKKRDFVEEYRPLTKETYGSLQARLGVPRNTNNQKLILLVRILLKNFRRKEIFWKSTHHLPRRHMGCCISSE
ncbi:unnamed protein product, partial [Pocillopora meandrina]